MINDSQTLVKEMEKRAQSLKGMILPIQETAMRPQNSEEREGFLSSEKLEHEKSLRA